MLSCVLGMAWLALSLSAHWRQVYNTPLGKLPTLGLRGAGSAALLVSALCCFAADHPSMAVLVWVMLLAGAALTVAMVLTWRPAWLAGVGRLFGGR